MKFGLSEIAFLVLLFAAVFTLMKMIPSIIRGRNAKKKIMAVVNDPEVLKEKLAHPTVAYGGKVEKIDTIVDMGEKLNIETDAEGVKITREKMKDRPGIKPAPEPKAKVKGKPAKIKKGKAKGRGK